MERRFVVLLSTVVLAALLCPQVRGGAWLNLGSIHVSQAAAQVGKAAEPESQLGASELALERAAEIGGVGQEARETLVKMFTLARDYESANHAFQEYATGGSDTLPGSLFLIRQMLGSLERGQVADAEQIRRIVAARWSLADYRRYAGDYEKEAEQLVSWADDQAGNHAYTQAESAYQMATVIAPSWTDGYLDLGGFYYDQKRWEEAETAYRSAEAIDPSDEAVFVGLGKVYLARGQASDADQLLSAGTKARNLGAFEWGRYMIGKAWEWKGDPLKAIDNYEAVVARYKQYGTTHAEPTWEAYFSLGSIASDRKEYDLAIQYFSGAASVSTEYGMDARALGYVADVYRLKGDPGQGIAVLKHAVALLDYVSSQDELKLSLLKKLGDSCWSLQDQACALAAYAQVLKLDPNEETARARVDSPSKSPR